MTKTHTIVYSRNNSTWRYYNVEADDVDTSKEIFNVLLRGDIESNFYKLMTKKEREDEFNKYEIITVCEVTPKKEKNANRKHKNKVGKDS